jgi:hypothetical protein
MIAGVLTSTRNDVPGRFNIQDRPAGAASLGRQCGASEQRLDRLVLFRPHCPNFSLDPFSQHSGAVFVKAVAAEFYLGGR